MLLTETIAGHTAQHPHRRADRWSAVRDLGCLSSGGAGLVADLRAPGAGSPQCPGGAPEDSRCRVVDQAGRTAVSVRHLPGSTHRVSSAGLWPGGAAPAAPGPDPGAPANRFARQRTAGHRPAAGGDWWPGCAAAPEYQPDLRLVRRLFGAVLLADVRAGGLLQPAGGPAGQLPSPTLAGGRHLPAGGGCHHRGPPHQRRRAAERHADHLMPFCCWPVRWSERRLNGAAMSLPSLPPGFGSCWRIPSAAANLEERHRS